MPLNTPKIDINVLMDDPNFAKVARKYANLAPQYKAVLQRITPDNSYLQHQITLLKMADEKAIQDKKIDTATEELNLNKGVYDARLDLLKAKGEAEASTGESKLGLLEAAIGARAVESAGKLDLARQKLGYDTALDQAKLGLSQIELSNRAYELGTKRYIAENKIDGTLAKDLLGIGGVIASAYGAYNKYNTANELAKYGYGLNSLF